MDDVIHGWLQRLKSVVDILEFEKGNVEERASGFFLCIIKEARCKKSKSQFQCESQLGTYLLGRYLHFRLLTTAQAAH